MSADDLAIGGARIPMVTAEEWVRTYTAVGQETGPAPYAYPAYDQYDQEHNDPCRLSDADLLAPALLNVRPTLRGFYALQRMRDRLEAALANEDLRHPLAEVNDSSRIAAMVKPLYAVLDDSDRQHFGIRGTTLSKVLHRKRPQSIVLHDRWVRACYVGTDRPVRPARGRSWADYMTQITLAVGDDLRNQPSQFEQLGHASEAADPLLTPLRLLDIVAWRSHGESRPIGDDTSAVESHPQSGRPEGRAGQRTPPRQSYRQKLEVS